MKNSDSVGFIDDIAYIDKAFVVEIDGVNSEQDLCEIYSDKLHFPNYFGFNWDALNDCLSDLTWISEYKVVIFHPNVPNLPFKDLVIYLSILCDVAAGWKNEDDFGLHEVVILFNEKDRDSISKLLK